MKSEQNLQISILDENPCLLTSSMQRAVIYHGDFHFTSCIIGNDNNVWYHDGMTTGSTCKNEGDFDSFSTKKLSKCKGKRLLLGHGDHVCGSNKIILVWKINSQLGHDVLTCLVFMPL